MSNFPCSLTRNVTSPSMKNLPFQSLRKKKDEHTSNSHHTTYTFLFKRLGECAVFGFREAHYLEYALCCFWKKCLPITQNHLIEFSGSWAKCFALSKLERVTTVLRLNCQLLRFSYLDLHRSCWEKKVWTDN